MFIAFDGLDGAGKTTQVNLLFNNLERNNIKCHLFDMGSFGYIGKYLKELKHQKGDCTAILRELLYYFEGHLFTKFYIEELRNQNTVVICDRWILTYLAYGANNGLMPEEVEYFINGIQKPDIYFFIDIEPQKALERICGYRAIDQAEIGYQNEMSKDMKVNRELFMSTQKKVRKNFKNAISKQILDIDIVNGALPQEKNEKYITEKVMNLLKL